MLAQEEEEEEKDVDSVRACQGRSPVALPSSLASERRSLAALTATPPWPRMASAFGDLAYFSRTAYAPARLICPCLASLLLLLLLLIPDYESPVRLLECSWQTLIHSTLADFPLLASPHTYA